MMFALAHNHKHASSFCTSLQVTMRRINFQNINRNLCGLFLPVLESLVNNEGNGQAIS